MNKKIILLSLLLLNLIIISSEKLGIQGAVRCEISYSNKQIEKLSEHTTVKHTKYGFESNPLTLTYKEKTERGVISLHGKVLQRLNIPKSQFLDITGQVKNGLSLNQLEYNKDFPLKSPLYITVKNNHGHYIFYKINGFKQIKLSEVDEAGYNSDIENNIKRYLTGGAVGMSFGIVIGGALVTSLVFAVAIKNFLFNN